MELISHPSVDTKKDFLTVTFPNNQFELDGVALRVEDCHVKEAM